MTSVLEDLDIVGPLPPLRGGIPRHTEQMCLALSKSWNVTVLNPKKLYPDWLYPGKSQFELRQPLSLEKCKVVTGSKLSLSLRMLKQAKSGGRTIVVWWNTYLAPFTVLTCWLARLRGSKVILFCHNVFPHDSSNLERRITKFVLKFADAFAVQSQEELVKLKSEREAPVVNVGKPNSLNTAIEEIPRKKLREGQITFLAIGLIRKYKNIPLLIDAFKRLPDENLSLKIVGECWNPDLKAIIESRSSGDSRISLNLNFVSEQDFLKEISLASYTCLPYVNATGSAILATSIGLGTPVIASNLESFTEVVTEGKDGYLFKTNSVESLAGTLQKSIDKPLTIELPKGSVVPSWSEFEEKLTRFLRSI